MWRYLNEPTEEGYPGNRMIICSVCGQENDELRLICSKCKSFLQGRVDALNLFETMWGLIETPQATFKRIVLARHKNYVWFLSFLFGIGLVFDVAWYKSLGGFFPSLIALIGTAFAIGPFIGVLVVLFLGVVFQQITRAMSGNATLRNVFSVIAYAAFPSAVVLVFIVPLEIAIFGSDFYGTNPPPMVIKPLEYTVLVALRGMAGLYATYLLIEGMMAATGFHRKKTLPLALSVVAVLAACTLAVHFVNV